MNRVPTNPSASLSQRSAHVPQIAQSASFPDFHFPAIAPTQLHPPPPYPPPPAYTESSVAAHPAALHSSARPVYPLRHARWRRPVSPAPYSRTRYAGQQSGSPQPAPEPAIQEKRPRNARSKWQSSVQRSQERDESSRGDV